VVAPMSRALTYAISCAFTLACAAWIWLDAKKRDWTGDGFANKPWKWALGTAILWIIAFPLYVLRRRKRSLLA